MAEMPKRFLKPKKLELNTEKIKAPVFNRTRKEKMVSWKWNGKKVEEVQTFKYLGFIFQKDGEYKEHIKELGKKGMLAEKQVWELG